MSEREEVVVCPECTEVFVRILGRPGRPRKYCTWSCMNTNRQRAYREREQLKARGLPPDWKY